MCLVMLVAVNTGGVLRALKLWLLACTRPLAQVGCALKPTSFCSSSDAGGVCLPLP
jgi:hypothetical protein